MVAFKAAGSAEKQALFTRADWRRYRIGREPDRLCRPVGRSARGGRGRPCGPVALRSCGSPRRDHHAGGQSFQSRWTWVSSLQLRAQRRIGPSCEVGPCTGNRNEQPRLPGPGTGRGKRHGSQSSCLSWIVHRVRSEDGTRGSGDIHLTTLARVTIGVGAARGATARGGPHPRLLQQDLVRSTPESLPLFRATGETRLQEDTCERRTITTWKNIGFGPASC